MAFITVNDTRLNVQQLQQKSSLPRQDLILCHGLASTMGFWMRHYVNALSKHFQITLFDMRGHGRSQTPETGYRPLDLANDLHGLMDELEIDKAHFLGHSFGGIAALKHAVMHPDRVESLVVLDSQIGLGRAQVKQAGWAEDQKFLDAMEKVGMYVDPKNPYYGIELISEVTRIVRCGQAVETGDARVDMVLSSLPLSVAKKWEILEQSSDALTGLTSSDDITPSDLARLAAPVMGLYGQNSTAKLSGQAIVDGLPNAQLALLPDAGHFFAATRAKEVIDMCKNFWGLKEDAKALDADTKAA